MDGVFLSWMLRCSEKRKFDHRGKIGIDNGELWARLLA